MSGPSERRGSARGPGAGGAARREPAAPGAADLAARQAAFERGLRAVLDTMEKVRFSGVPRLEVEFGLDTRDPASLKTGLNFVFEGAATPWGQGSQLQLTLQTQTSATNRQWLETEIRLRADQWKGTNFLVRKPSVWWRLEVHDQGREYPCKAWTAVVLSLRAAWNFEEFAG